jgi:catechol 2,3-dioxygenase-like lactoylglutathione lyase family enzyme
MTMRLIDDHQYIWETPPMSTEPRVQLALNVSDIDSAVDFYSRMFDAQPHKRRPGYANFALESPALKLVLIENHAAPGTLNHLGVEVPGVQDVVDARGRLAVTGLDARDEDDVVCCHARQDKVWVSDPDGAAWEFYTITDDHPVTADLTLAEQGCCGSTQPSDTTGEPCCAS